MAIARDAAIFTNPAVKKLAPATCATVRSTVSTSTAVCIASDIPSHRISATALQAAIRAVPAWMDPPAMPRLAPSGRARKTRNNSPPSIADWAVMVRPCSTMDR